MPYTSRRPRERERVMVVTATTTASPPSRTLPELFGSLPEIFAERYDPDAPWALLGEALEAVLAGLPSADLGVRLLPEVHLAGARIVSGRRGRTHRRPRRHRPPP